MKHEPRVENEMDKSFEMVLQAHKGSHTDTRAQSHVDGSVEEFVHGGRRELLGFFHEIPWAETLDQRMRR